ncbi:hypothetical protein [uncultured Neglectibacter sp.]|uniref:hypothetical protein n=1 Tax=uncultured Neglectibacter sp. TaxID=1924108 RepID=UPI0034DEAE94
MELTPRTRFKYFIWAISALGHLSQGTHYRNWKDATVCREAVPALQLFLLEWAAERSKQREKEPNPAVGYGLENEIAAAVDFLTDVGNGDAAADKELFYQALNTFYKVERLRSRHITPEEYRRIHEFELEEKT